MSSPVPQPVSPKSSGFASEVSTATSFADLSRFFSPKKMKVSRNSPPVLNVDVTEAEFVWDRTQNRLYTVSNGALRYVTFT